MLQGTPVTAFQYRLVGKENVGDTLSDVDIELIFALSKSDVDIIRTHFGGRTKTRSQPRDAAMLGAAVQLSYLRATGRAPDQVSRIPYPILQRLCADLALNEQIAIGSMRTLYRAKSTRYDHLARLVLLFNFSTVDDAVWKELEAVMQTWSRSANSVEELVREAELWLHGRKILLPGDRPLREMARKAFSDIEQAILQTIKTQVPLQARLAALIKVFARKEAGQDGTNLEWLKKPPGRHGPKTLAQTRKKIDLLQELGVDQWDLSAIPIGRMRGYAHNVQSRPPIETARLKEDTRHLEVVCFLRVMLMELSDTAVYLFGRRVRDIIRDCAKTAQGRQSRTLAEYRAREEQMRTVLHAEGSTDEQKVASLKEILPVEAVKSESFAAQVRETMCGQRKEIAAVLNAVEDFNIQGMEGDRTLQQLKILQHLKDQGANDLPDGFDAGAVSPVWQDLVNSEDRSKAMGALQACAMTSLLRGLRGGKLWVEHSWEHRNFQDKLIPAERWEAERKKHIAAMELYSDPKLYLRRVIDTLDTAMTAAASAVTMGEIEIDEHGLFRVPAIVAMDVPDEATRTRDNMFKIIGTAQFCDMIVEIDAKTGFSEEILGHRAKSVDELVTCYAAVLAHGTEMTAAAVAHMIPNMEVSRVKAAMSMLELPGRLRKANERVAVFQNSHEICDSWGEGNTASADMMSLDASRYLFNARVDPRRRTHGVGLYLHILDRYGIFYDQPVVHKTRQQGVAVEGAYQYNLAREERERLDWLAVDTHGYTNVAMAVAKPLGFDLYPQLKNLKERQLFALRGMEIPDNLEAVVEKIQPHIIYAGWDDYLRLLASIREGLLTPLEAMRRLGSDASDTPLFKTADYLGRLLRSIYLCDYFAQPELRRAIHTVLNRGESVHTLERAIYTGRMDAQRGRRQTEMKAISGAHALLTNVVIAWNTSRMQGVVDRWRKAGEPVENDWLARVGPVHFRHINFRGRMSFMIEQYKDALLQQPAQRKAAGA